MNHHNTALALGIALLLMGGCDSGSHSHAKVKVNIPQEKAAADTRPLGANGLAIDPTKKKVIVVNAPSYGHGVDKKIAGLKAQHAKTGEKLTKMIGKYSRNIGNSASSAKIAAEMDKDLEVYKRQSLELYKTQLRLSERE